MKGFSTVLLTLLITSLGYSQSNYQLDVKQSSVIIQGTSSVHDWESVVEDFSVLTTIGSAEDGTINIKSFSFTAQVTSIESGKRIMNRKTMSALNEKDHPQIIFTLTGIDEINADAVTATGILNIAGKEHAISVSTAYSTDNNILQLTGSKAILMSDFGINPPTAMMGTMKTGDEVTIDFKLYLTKQ